jgi:hypothetical protein
MVTNPQNPLQPRWSKGLLPDRLSAADIDAILAASGTRISASSHEWAAATTEGQEHLPQRSPQEWAAYYIDIAIVTLERSWRTMRMETPASRRDWAGNVRDSANRLLEYLNAEPGYVPSDMDNITPTIMALTRPHDAPLTMPNFVDYEQADLLLPLLSEIESRTTRPDPYWITPIEALQQRNAPAWRVALGSPEPAPPRGPMLSDALRMAIAGLQIISLRAQALFEITSADAGRKPNTGGRALVYFAIQISSFYRKLSGQRLPSDTPPGHTKPRRGETRFYQAICAKASFILRDGPPELVTILRSRGQPHGFLTAESDLREAWSSGGASPRKR